MQNSIGYYDSPLGLLKMEGAAGGLQALLFTDSIKEAPAESPLTRLVAQQLDEYFKGQRKTFDFPFGQQGTPFQEQVWNLLCSIPYGTTVSYAHLAKRYGDIKAIRAVAAANGKNKLAIVVPCHRVIGTNATLTGYAGGLWRKRWLLAHEAKFHSGVQSLFG